MPGKGRVSEKLWGQGCDCGTFHTFHTFWKKKKTIYCLKKKKTEQEEYNSTDDTCYLKTISTRLNIPLWYPELAEKHANEDGS